MRQSGSRSFDDPRVVATATQLAVLAAEIHDAFLRRDEERDDATVVDPDPDIGRVEVMSRTGARDATQDRTGSIVG